MGQRKHYTQCKACICAKSKTWNNARTVEYKMYHGAKARAKRKGLPFDIDLADIVVPPICPVLGIPMDKPSIDQHRPGAGYTKDNITIISHRANLLKSNATLAELKAIVAYLENNQ